MSDIIYLIQFKLCLKDKRKSTLHLHVHSDFKTASGRSRVVVTIPTGHSAFFDP